MTKPIILSEQWEWKTADVPKLPVDFDSYSKQIDGKDSFCVKVKLSDKELLFSTSYFIGADWIYINNSPDFPIYVKSKLNDENQEIDCLNMLFEAMSESENFNYLDGLCEIDFDAPQINITQQQDILSPFLIIQFLQILKRIVQKGLKKTYYPVEQNLNAKVKGKILVNKTIKKNILQNQFTKTFCKYDEFGYNGDENKILKKAFLFSQSALQQHIAKQQSIEGIIGYIRPAFENVTDDIQIDKIKVFKPNPMYKEYGQALKLALLILKRYSFNITETIKTEIPTPPFWIDMSKLFELYVFKKLREIFPKRNEVMFQFEAKGRFLDFLINNSDVKMVVDAKYKPRYKDSSINIDDMRQICGYARMEKVYNELHKPINELIDCLVIYSHQSCSNTFSKADLTKTSENSYVNFYKLGIKLPEIQ
ncbi:hypothetical protein FACS1894155_11050 [Bacteroidia bacterium]|nr:hypothetical protein FACS1894155_11050 [Bacteroidia bacterium]